MEMHNIEALRSLSIKFHSGNFNDVKINVSSTSPVDIYILDENHEVLYRGGTPIDRPLFQSSYKQSHIFTIGTILPEPWFLVIENSNNFEITVRYSVSMRTINYNDYNWWP